MDLSTLLHKARLHKGLDYEQMLPFHQTYVEGLETGAIKPTPEDIKELSVLLEIPKPILLFMTLEEKDVKKKEAFKLLQPAVLALIEEVTEGAFSE